MQTLSPLRIFLAFLKLGLTSFGGPVAHLGFFREEFVTRRRLIQEEAYANLVALCQFLPGPASSQVGIGLGLSFGGLPGALAAWCGFTLPSAVALILFAYGVTLLDPNVVQTGWLHGLKVVAVAVVAQAIWGMAKNLCPDRPRGTVAVLAAILTLSFPGVGGQIAAILLGACLGLLFLHHETTGDTTSALPLPGKRTALFSLGFFILLLGALPFFAAQGSHMLVLIDSFYRSGSLVFGGGHVVLPLLQAEVVTPGWIDRDLFLAGYGAAQAVPGPLFTFSAYLGAAQSLSPNGWTGGLICLLAIFLPSFLLVIGILPFWHQLQSNHRIRKALVGTNAAVVGLLIAAFYDPVWSRGVLSVGDFGLALGAFGMLQLWKWPPWLVIGITGTGGALLGWMAG